MYGILKYLPFKLQIESLAILSLLQAVVLPDGIWFPSFLSVQDDSNFVRWKQLVKKKDNYYIFGEIKKKVKYDATMS